MLGNLRPDLVSFLPSMRQYAGNWATGLWALAPGAEEKIDTHIVKAAKVQKHQLAETYGHLEAEVVMQPGPRLARDAQPGRGLNSSDDQPARDDMDTHTLREGEFCCNAIVGFNFGDGHLHDRRMIEAVQKRCRFAPGELTVVWAESEALGSGRQNYLVIDAAMGVVERGNWAVKDAVEEQPWLPNGPIPTVVTYRKPGYERVTHTPQVAEKALVMV